jgi:serine phosphatase RsbU (regulator of sigma subunit)
MAVETLPQAETPVQALRQEVEDVRTRLIEKADTPAVRALSAEALADRERKQQEQESIDGVARAAIPYENGVSGDFSKVIPTETGYFVVIEDHAGHGVGGAALREVAHTPASDEMEKMAPDSAAYIKKLHHRIGEHLKGRSTVPATAFEISKAPDNRSIRYVGQGNMFMLLDGKTGSIKQFVKPSNAGPIGMPLNKKLAMEAQVSPASLGYEAGDVFLTGTDGLWETTDAKGPDAMKVAMENFKANVETMAKEQPDQPVEQLVTRILKTLKDRVDDDITLIAIKL